MENVGYATLQIIPSFRGFDSAVSKGLAGAGFAAAGTAAGVAAGSAASTGLSGTLRAAVTSPAFIGLGKVAGLALAGGVAVGLVASTTTFAGFESQMNEVFTLLPGISQQAMDDMTGQVKDFGREFGVLPTDVVPALYQALSAGVPQGNVFDFLETAQRAAKGGVTDLTTAVDGLSSVVNAYGPEALSAQQASDLMFTTVRLGKTTMEELSTSLFNVTPTAAALGVGFSDVTAALATMTSQGVPTSVATTQLRQLFVELSKEGTKTSEVFQGIAGKSFQQFIAEGGNTQQALQLLEQAAAQSGVGVQDLFGSVEAGQAALALTGPATDKFSESLAAMDDSAGATDTAFETMQTGLQPLIDKFKAWGQVMLIEVGERIAGLIEWMSEHKGIAITLAGIVGGVLLVAIAAYTVSMISAAAATIAATWPILAIIAAIGLLVAGIVWAWNNWDWFREGVTAVWEAIKTIAVWAWENVLQPVFQAIGAFIVDWLIPAFQQYWEWAQIVWNGIVEVVTWAWETVIKPIWDAIYAFIQDYLIPYYQLLWQVAQEVWNGVTSAVSTAWGIMQGIFNAIVGGIVGVRDGIWGAVEAVVGFFRDLPGRIAGVAGGIWDFLLTNFKNVLNGIVGMWNRLAIPSFTIGGWSTPFGDLPSWDTPRIDFPDLPTFHSGGMVPGRPGQDVLSILQPGEVVLSRAQVAEVAAFQARGRGRGRSVGDVYVAVDKPNASAAEIGDELAWKIRVA